AFFLYPAIEPNGELEVQRLIVGAAGLVMVASALLVRKQPILSVGWGKANLKFGLWLGLALAIITIVLRNRVTDIFSGLTALDGVSLFVWLLLAFVEETVFRGYIQLRLENWLGERWGWVATAAAFMIYQIPRLLATSTLDTWPVELAFAFAQGLVLGFIMKKCGSTLAPMLYRAVSGWL
ncbi:MAG TPA: CPBP family intramembrane glutamic endopeptidase, partial [Longilinea sp.]|nr:CPBP family intramembrane glutamic endopeptidase [Longilinea sp.]